MKETLATKVNLNIHPEMSEYLGIGKTRAYQLAGQPDFPSFRIGKRLLVNRERLDEWIAKQIDARRESVSKQA